jgi:hypothetical protein
LIQKLSIQRLKIDSGAGTVDIEYQLVEKDRVKLNFKEVMVVVVGLLGLVQQLFGHAICSTKMHIDPPMGDGRKLTFASKYLFQTYSVSFLNLCYGKTSII